MALIRSVHTWIPLLLVVLLSFTTSACVELMAAYGGPAAVKQLSVAPFRVPEDIHVPAGAKILSKNRAAKGGDGMIAFETQMDLDSLYSLYEARIAPSGLTLNSGNRRERSFHQLYFGWPDNKIFSVTCVDRGYSSAQDVRMCSISLQGS